MPPGGDGGCRIGVEVRDFRHPLSLGSRSLILALAPEVLQSTWRRCSPKYNIVVPTRNDMHLLVVLQPQCSMQVRFDQA